MAEIKHIDQIIRQSGTTEIGGFFAIYPEKNQPCSAYVASLADAELYLSAHELAGENRDLKKLLKQSMTAINNAYEEERCEAQGLQRSADRHNNAVREYQHKVHEILKTDLLERKH